MTEHVSAKESKKAHVVRFGKRSDEETRHKGKGYWFMNRTTLFLVLVTFFVGGVTSNLYAMGARPRAMGGAGIAVADDENAVWLNPAGMSQIDRAHASVSAQVVERNKFMSDHLAYVGKMFQAGGTRKVTLEDYLESDYEFRSEPEKVSNYSWGIGLSRMKRSPELNEEFGNEFIREEQTAFVLAFATRFPIAERLTRRPELYAGLSMRYVDHDWKNPSLTNSLNNRDVYDLNASLFYKANQRLNIGARLDGLISETHDTNPQAVQDNSFTFNLGGAYTFGEKRDTLVAVDIINVFNASRSQDMQLRLGFERNFLDNDLALRLGSYDGTLTLGFGVKLFEGFRMDYAYENFTTFREHHVAFKLPF